MKKKAKKGSTWTATQRDRYIKREPSASAKGKPEVIVSKHTGRVLGRFASKAAAEKGWKKTMKRIHSF